MFGIVKCGIWGVFFFELFIIKLDIFRLGIMLSVNEIVIIKIVFY